MLGFIKKMNMTAVGITVSLIYLASITLMRWEDLCQLAVMPLNAMGDFLAGVFGPLTLFWLILGFMQQRKEISQNTEALERQASELSASVTQHRAMVALQEKHLQQNLEQERVKRENEKRASAPFFSLHDVDIDYDRDDFSSYKIVFKNIGKPAVWLNLSSEPPLKGGAAVFDETALNEASGFYVEWIHPTPFLGCERLSFTFNSRSLAGYEHEQTIVARVAADGSLDMFPSDFTK